jgi:hypothetical protein
MERQLAASDSGIGYVHYLRRDLAPKQYAQEIVQLNLSGEATREKSSFRQRAGRTLRRLRPR